jgi:L-lactate dehydrogenase
LPTASRFVRRDIKAGGYEDCAGADIVILTAGANQRPGNAHGLNAQNARVFASIVPE